MLEPNQYYCRNAQFACSKTQDFWLIVISLGSQQIDDTNIIPKVERYSLTNEKG